MTGAPVKTSYGDAIRLGFEYAMERDERCFAIGQGLWSPWYVGNSMRDLDKKFGKERVIDTPVSELATTGAAVGAALNGYHPIVVHPRMDFMILAADQIVNQAAGQFLESLQYQETYRDPDRDGEGTKRILFSLTLRSHERTLTGEEADQIRDDVVQAITTQLNGQLLA